MAVSESDRGALGEAKYQHATTNTVVDEDQIEKIPSHPDQDLTHPSLAHAPALENMTHTNGHVDADPSKLCGMDGHTPLSAGMPTQLSTDDAPGLPEAGAITLGSSSNVSAPTGRENPVEDSDHLSTETASGLVLQPTSDLREQTQPEPLSSELTSEIKEQKHQDDLESDPGLADGIPAIASESITLPSATESHVLPISSSPLPSEETSGLPKEARASSALDDSQEMPAQTSTQPSPVLPVGDLASEAPLDPAPPPTIPSDVTAPPSAPPTSSTDQVMQDAPSLPTKLAREREDDDFADGPIAKRTKTDEPSAETEFKVPERPATNIQSNGSHPQETLTSLPPMTKPQQRFLQRTIGNVKRISAAKWFTAPVDYKALNLPRYPEIITKPMDLKTLEDNLRADRYNSVDNFVQDFNQIIQNTQAFNGSEHLVTVQALEMKGSFDKQMQQLPGPEVKEPTASDRKKKAPDTMAVKISHSRRESRSSLPGSARSPPSAGSPQTFALGPEGVPLIRRDSTLGDGRPKREIHRPAPRDLPYANQKPKKKKYQTELRFCEKVLSELTKPKYTNLAWPFMTPVDPVALNIPSYHSIIKKPMDFGTIRAKLDHGEYEKANEFEADARLVFQNCYKFNRPGDDVSQAGRQFEEIFNAEWANRHQWIEANTPSSGPQSPGSSPDPDESEDEEEEEEEEEEQTQLTKLQQQIAAMSRQVELITQKKKSPPAPPKKIAKPPKPAKKDSKKMASTTPAKAAKKATSKPAKQEKAPYVTYEQKQDISNRINSLSETKMATALKIIRDNMPNLKGVEDDELELDIDELSNEVLYKLLVFVKKHVPHAEDSPVPRNSAASSSAAPARKKNKPMSKHEQEARIAQVQSGLSAFQNKGQSSSSGHIAQSVEHPGSEDDDDDDEDSESEEE